MLLTTSTFLTIGCDAGLASLMYSTFMLIALLITDLKVTPNSDANLSAFALFIGAESLIFVSCVAVYAILIFSLKAKVFPISYKNYTPKDLQSQGLF